VSQIPGFDKSMWLDPEMRDFIDPAKSSEQFLDLVLEFFDLVGYYEMSDLSDSDIKDDLSPGDLVIFLDNNGKPIHSGILNQLCSCALHSI
jgi:hypothetical protein